MVQRTEFTFILKPSPIAGIGVFAVHDIPKGMEMFSVKTQPRRLKVKDVPEEFLKYCIFLEGDECLGPEQFDRMEIGWYLNHSEQPNVIKTSDKRAEASRDIRAGEEILMDYNQLNEPEELKEAYYKK